MLFVKEGWVGPYLTYIIPGAHSCQIIIARGEKWGKNYTHTHASKHADRYIKWKRIAATDKTGLPVMSIAKKKNLNADYHLYTCRRRHPYICIILYSFVHSLSEVMSSRRMRTFFKCHSKCLELEWIKCR